MDLKMVVTLGLFIVFVFTSKAGASWSTWDTWSVCSTTCGYGVQTRERQCTDGQCIGHSQMHTTCFTEPCQDIEQPNTWTSWGEWSECTQTCGGGTRTRTRTCTSGNVTDCCESSDPGSCLYEHTQSRDCINDDCYGTWAAWKSWGACSSECGEGQQSRERKCELEGTVCIGAAVQNRACYIQCLTQERIIQDMDDKKTCYPRNPCQHDGLCASNGDHITCICRGDWRGRDCTSMCIHLDDRDACINKQGIFHVCGKCTMFIICSRGNFVPMTCTGDRIWTGDRCEVPTETNVLCVEE